MTDFDHGVWARARAELALNPLPPVARSVVDRILAGEIMSIDNVDSTELAALKTLTKAGVIDSYFNFSFGESKQLRAAHERGLIGELFA